MSCNGCRILRKGCSDACVLRPCIQWIDGADAQAHATVFVAKFFGRSTLLSLLSSVPLRRRPAVFRSLLYEACGRTINPVSGATGLLWTGTWHLCHAAVETVLGGGTIRPLSDLGAAADAKELYRYQKRGGVLSTSSSSSSSSPLGKRKRDLDDHERSPAACDLYLCLMPPASPADGRWREDNRRASTPSATSESSVTTTNAGVETAAEEPALLNLFV